MMSDMYMVMARIDEIQTKFGLKNQAVQNQSDTAFQKELHTRITEQNKTNPLSENTGIVEKDHYTINEIKGLARETAKKYNVPADLVTSVIQQESSFNPKAVSGKGAMGLMQLMPEVAKNLGVRNPFSPPQNMEGGVKLLRSLLDKNDWDYRKALAAYNAGQGAVNKHDGVPPYRETENYVQRVIENYVKQAFNRS